MVKVFCRNNGETRCFQEGTSLLEMLPEFKFPQPFRIISARVNNVSQGLKFRVYNNRDVKYLDGTSYSGRRVYCRSLCFLLSKAASDAFPGSRIYMEHAISSGYYINFYKADGSGASADDVAAISARMRALVGKDIPFMTPGATVFANSVSYDATLNANPVYYHSVLPYWEMEDGKITKLEMLPIELNMSDVPGLKGYPAPCDPSLVLDDLRKASAEYGTEFFVNDKGLIEVKL